MKNVVVYMIISFFVGVLLTLMPLPHFLNWFRPQWIFLILLFWVVRAPEYCDIGIAWLMGFLMDCFLGTLPGQHALVYTFLIYIVLKFHAPFSNLPRWQQMGVILFFSTANLLLQKIIFNTTGNNISGAEYWLPILWSTLFWPWIYALLNHLYPKRIIY